MQSDVRKRSFLPRHALWPHKARIKLYRGLRGGCGYTLVERPMSVWDVFLSYARADAGTAQTVSGALRSAGLRTFDYMQIDSPTPSCVPLKLAYGLLESNIFCLLASEASWGPEYLGASQWIPEELRMFSQRPTGMWSEDPRPAAVVVRTVGWMGIHVLDFPILGLLMLIVFFLMFMNFVHG